MLVTVGICTWNRAELLDATLEQMCLLEVPHGVDWELLVVNNNCTDATDAVIERYQERLPLKRLFEPTPGKSHALNHAIREAKGEYIIWTDDDVRVCPNWIGAYVEAFQKWPSATIFGGPIDPWFESDPPQWLVAGWSHVAAVFGSRDMGNEPIRLSRKQYPFGANLAMKASTQRKYLFDTDLGPRPDSELRGEEAALLRHMLDVGEEGRWVPGARVEHFVPNTLCSRESLYKHFYGTGQQRAIMQAKRNGADHVEKAMRSRWRSLVAELRYRIRRRCSSPSTWVADLRNAAIASGWRDQLAVLRNQSTAADGRGD